MPVQECLSTGHILSKLIWGNECHDTIDPGSKISEMIQSNSKVRKLFMNLALQLLTVYKIMLQLLKLW